MAAVRGRGLVSLGRRVLLAAERARPAGGRAAAGDLLWAGPSFVPAARVPPRAPYLCSDARGARWWRALWTQHRVRAFSRTAAPRAKRDADRPDDEAAISSEEPDGGGRSAGEVSEVMVARDRSGLGDSSGTELVSHDPNWVPKEVMVIPVFRRPIFPGIATPIALTDPELCEAIMRLKNQFGSNLYVGLFLAKNQRERDDGKLIKNVSEVYEIGCLGQVVHIQGVNHAGMQLLIAGTGRVLIKNAVKTTPFLTVEIERCADKPFDSNDKVIKAYMLEIMATVKSIVKLEHFFKEQLQTILTQVNVQNPAHLADITTSMTTSDRESLQAVLETLDVQDRLAKALRLLKIELEQAEVQKTIQNQMEDNVSKMQRKHFLTEQLKVIKKELGMEVDEKEELVRKMTAKLAEINAPPAAEKVIQEQLKKISMLEPASPEFSMTRTYLDWLVAIPWGISTQDMLDVDGARSILDDDHHGMKDVKDRILEFIAVGVLKGTVQGKIICLNGPPGVGKTSIGKSIAASLNREFFRFSVGGMTDVSEIKGHRRTYVGAMPGKIVQALKTAGSNNPVIMLDEIDKLGRGYQGDPASALLEVLDPSQNKDFMDHYIDVPIDLSQCLFVCTSNELSTIPGPLRDRMEVIQVSGYTADDKVQIARKHLLPKAREEHGLKPSNSVVSDAALRTLIVKYCREPGVRNLQKQIEKLLRKVAFQIATKEVTKVTVSENNLEKFVGAPIFPKDRIYDSTPVGVVMGLAWTSLGGATLFIECVDVTQSDKGALRCTGQMGDVMKESTDVAFTVARKWLRKVEPDNKFFDQHVLHMHIPEGATPKDGPSAGITMATTLLSLAMHKPVRQKLAMTGEMTLTEKVLPVGGIKEKVLGKKTLFLMMHARVFRCSVCRGGVHGFMWMSM